LVLGLLGLWARHWRDEITSHGTYAQDTFDAANTLTHTLLSLAVMTVTYVALCLLLTPRSKTTAVEDAVAPVHSDEH
jgi:hypothetical protein